MNLAQPFASAASGLGEHALKQIFDRSMTFEMTGDLLTFLKPVAASDVPPGPRTLACERQKELLACW